ASKIGGVIPQVVKDVESLGIDSALKSLAALTRELNRYIDGKAPWKNAKTDPSQAGNSLYTVLEGLRVVSLLLAPVLPHKMSELRKTLFGKVVPVAYESEARFGFLKPGQPLGELKTLFPRIEIEPQPQINPANKPKSKNENKGKTMTPSEPAKPVAETGEGLIDVDDFFKAKLVTAKIITAEAVEGTDKLVKLSVDAGEAAPRTVVAGIRQSYAPETLVGKRIVLVANLKPRSLKGIESRGMLLCAKTTVDGKGKLILISPEDEVPTGTEVG
ncbi:MAG: methionine--tRNA ligase, partial [Spirochaetia bacterium]|nr:methionine--tRNA ligase [Spirochaetia bacterium]